MRFRTCSAVVALIALGMGVPHGVAAAENTDEIRELRQKIEEMRDRLDQLEDKQTETEEKVEKTREDAVLSEGSEPGRFRLPGTDTELEISGYVKADFIYDTQESVGDLFITESLNGDGDARFRAHARQSRLSVKTYTPTDWGELTTHIEGDFFGVDAGTETFSNSADFRLRHAAITIGGLRAGQYWTNFMPIESYPLTVDFQGPAGIPFIRQAQLRYTHDISDQWSVSGSIENSEFSGRNATDSFSESTTGDNEFGINAGLDKAPDVTAATTYSDDWGLVKLAGVGRYLGSPNNQGDDAFGWGVNLSGNTEPWQDGVLRASLTYGDGVGRYILNGFGQDGFVDAQGDVEPIESYGTTVQIGHNITEDVQALLAYGRFEALDTFAPGDLDNTNSVHATVFWNPIDYLTFGSEVIWGNRENADGSSNDNIRLQQSVQVTF